MKINSVEKQYEALEPLERVNLTLTALARNDEMQAALLKRTCPVKKYSAVDLDYRFLLSMLERICSELTLIINKILCDIKLCKVMIYTVDVIDDLDCMTEELSDVDKRRSNVLGKCRDNASQRRQRLYVELKSLYEGLCCFSKKSNLLVEPFMKLCEFDFQQTSSYLLKEDLDDVEVHEPIVEYYCDKFLKIWQN